MLNSEKISHYILTRFSLIYSDWKESTALVNEERQRWFIYRANIFHNTLLNSVLKQTVPIDKIILLFDLNDLDFYLKYIRNDCKLIHPIFTRVSEMNSEINAFLLPKKYKRISVSRVDSDDILAFDYIERKIETYKKVGKKFGSSFIVSNTGYRSNLKYIQPCVDFKSPFITVFYENYSGTLDMGGNHLNISERNPIYCRYSHWVQLIHDSNVGNLFDVALVKRVNAINWPSNIIKPAPNLLRGYILNNEFARFIKRRIYTILLRSQIGVTFLRNFTPLYKSFSRFLNR